MTIAMASRVLNQRLRAKYPATPPITFPMTHESIVVKINRLSVQGSAVRIRSITGVGNWKKEMPKSPVNTLFQNVPYCSSHDPPRP